MAETPKARRRVVIRMADIWVAAAWVVAIFAVASGALLFGYLRFFRWSQADELQAANGDVDVRTVRPLGRRTDERLDAWVGGRNKAA